ncbi:MAG: hypothetical protein A4S09_12475 [Proteobacteria bacterium SG_bin7]|nr:MAG: hypothetical protein A4S09_12475 [Proteobacteria bacterium SG_bin7]
MAKKNCWIYTTTSSLSEAQEISDLLLEKKLIACANIFPSIESRYRWKGKVCKSKETAVIFKTRSSLYKKVEKEILRIHSYSVPCLVKISWEQTGKEFAQWILGSTKV